MRTATAMCPRCGAETNRLGICKACAAAAEGVLFDRVCRAVFFPAVWPFRVGETVYGKLAGLRRQG